MSIREEKLCRSNLWGQSEGPRVLIFLGAMLGELYTPKDTCLLKHRLLGPAELFLRRVFFVAAPSRFRFSLAVIFLHQ